MILAHKLYFKSKMRYTPAACALTISVVFVGIGVLISWVAWPLIISTERCTIDTVNIHPYSCSNEECYRMDVFFNIGNHYHSDVVMCGHKCSNIPVVNSTSDCYWTSSNHIVFHAPNNNSTMTWIFVGIGFSCASIIGFVMSCILACKANRSEYTPLL